MITRKSAEALQEVLKDKMTHIKDSLGVRRDQYLKIDRYLQKESDATAGKVVGQLVNEMGDKSKIRDMEIPIAFIQSQTAIAYAAGVFLGGEPIFAAVTDDRTKQETAAMLTALCKRDQHRLNWRGELLQSLADAINYNLAPVEIIWGAKRMSSVKTVIREGSPQTGAISPIVYEGNIIRRVDPYNAFGDSSVDPYQIHEHGAFSGYVERFNYIRMKRFFAELDNLYIVKHNVKAAFGSACAEGLHYKPIVRNSAGRLADPDDWRSYWGNAPSIDPGQSGGRYEVVTMYTRIIPREYALEVPNAGQLKVMKLIYVNNVLLYMEPIHTPHEFLPMVWGQFYRGGWDKKSFSEYVLDLQDTATSMIRGTMNSMRRAVSDRGIYDPTRVRKADIDSTNPVAKIPVTSNAYNSDIRTAYYPIPYEDRASANFRTNFGLIMSLADQTTGQNQAAQGSFIKGNKTRDEFDTIMTNSAARMQLGNLELYSSLIAPTQQIILTNYLLYAENGQIEDGATNQTVEVDVVKMRENVPAFKMASGILPSTKIASTDIKLQALNLFTVNQELAIEYDAAGIAISILQDEGFPNLTQFKRTPEQAKQYAENLAASRGVPKQ